MAKSNYNCSEQELYTIVQTGWQSCLQYQTRFQAFKAKYTPAFIDAKLADLLLVRQLPDEQQRNDAYETAGVFLKAAGKTACEKWQMLKRYIADAYVADLQKTKTEAAGQNYYLKASSNNWDSVKGLMTSGSTFITANLADLTAADNMPLTFQADFDAAKSDFEKRHQEFLQAEEEATVGADNKVTANNRLHTDLMVMLLDGQEIFKNEEPLYKQFVFADLLYLASGAGTAGVKGQITDAVTKASLENIKVTVQPSGKTTVSGIKGRYEINQLAAGIYTIIFEGEGYETKTITNWEVKVGTISTLDVELTPLP